MEEDQELTVSRKKSEAAPRRRPKRLVIPRRAPSIIIPGMQIIFITSDKTTCAEPKEDPYRKPKKLNPCLKSPLTLYELAAKVVDDLTFPEAFSWTEEEVAEWVANDVLLPQYRDCVLANHINGLRLLLLEDPSNLPMINIHDFNDIARITAHVRREFGTEFVLFCRSIGLPPRKPLTHCTYFKSRTGPSWGIRQNWTRCDILRWMKILMPAPIYLDHWDLVWYRKPDFPAVKFARVEKPTSQVHIPHYKIKKDICKEYQAPRKFLLRPNMEGEVQMIWMEHRPGSPIPTEIKKKKKKKNKMITKSKETRLVPEKVRLEGLKGKDLILARRKMPTPKFLQ